MSEENKNPTTPPVEAGQTGGQVNPEKTTPAIDPTDQSKGGKQEDVPKIEVDASVIEQLKRDAGRWQKHQRDVRLQRRSKRSTDKTEYQDIDGASPEVVEALRARDTKLDELSLVNRTLVVKDKIRDIIESDEYKNVPKSVKKAIIRNPLGFVDPTSESVEDAVSDIQEYLDDELDNIGISTADGKSIDKTIEGQDKTHQIPPVKGSGPASPSNESGLDINGKNGPARSTAILANLLKNRGK